MCRLAAAYIILSDMSRIDDYKRELADTTDRVALLRRGSNLPGPRGNLELMYAAAATGSEADLREWLRLGFPNPEEEQPTDEFLAMCGIVGLGHLLATGRDELVDELRGYASDRRWRVREAVAMALQAVGDDDVERVLAIAAGWLSDRPYVQRAAVAAVSEPRLLRDPSQAREAVDIIEKATANLATLDDRRSDEVRTLRQALAYCWSVVVASAPGYGRERFESLVGRDRQRRTLAALREPEEEPPGPPRPGLDGGDARARLLGQEGDMNLDLRPETFDPAAFVFEPWWFERPEGIIDNLDPGRLRLAASRDRVNEAWALLRRSP